MTGPAGVLSDSPSPLRLRKTNSPFLTRALFEAAGTLPPLELNDEVDIHLDNSDSNNNLSRSAHLMPKHQKRTTSSSSFRFTKSTSNIHLSLRQPVVVAAVEIDTCDRPKVGRVSKLITSFSIPSLLQAHQSSSRNSSFTHSLLGFKADRETPATVAATRVKQSKYRRCMSMVIDSPSSESAMSKSPTSTFSADSWGDQTHTLTLTQSQDQDQSQSQSQNQCPNNNTRQRQRPVLEGTGATESMPMSKSQPSLSHLFIGPIARKHFREQTVEKEKAIMQTSQLLSIPGKEWVRALQSDYEAPCLDLDPFTPYTPGIPDSAHVPEPETERMASSYRPLTAVPKTLIDLDEYCQRVDVRPKEDEDEEDSDEEEEVVQQEKEKPEERKEQVKDDDKVQEDKQTWVALEGCDGLTNALILDFLCNDFATATLHETNTVLDSSTAGNKLVLTSNAEKKVPLETIETTPETNVKDPAPTASTTSANVSMASSPPKGPTTESEAIAKQWRRDQSTNLPIYHSDGSKLEDRTVTRSPTLMDPPYLEKRQQSLGSQSRLGSSGSIRTGSKRDLCSAGPSSPQVASSSSSSSRLASPVPETIATYEVQESIFGDDTSIPTTSVSSDESSVASSTEQDPMTITSPVSSTESGLSAILRGKRPANIDTTLVRPPVNVNTNAHGHVHVPAAVKSAPKPLEKGAFKHLKSTSMLFRRNTDDSEQVVSSKVSRSGKLFAKKIKTIAGFEYNTAKKLGKGNFGIVYQGKRIQDGVEVAIKKITRKLPGEIEKLGLVQREMRVCRLFNNKTGIVPLLDIITTSKHHYLIFEKAEGDLAEMIRIRCKDAADRRSNRMDLAQQQYQQQLLLPLQQQQPPVSPTCSLGNVFTIDEIRSVMYTVVLATRALHKEGYSHKDIKPANILFRNGRGLLCDFGLCSQVNELPQNQFFGTQDYASPEARRVGRHRQCNYIQGDVYSLGAVLYELATGSVLSKVISQGLNWHKIVLFGGKEFCELLQGMVNDIEKRWDIEQVANSRFWTEASCCPQSSCSPLSTCSSHCSAERAQQQEMDAAKVALPSTPLTMGVGVDERSHV
ncbi:hypothetical protein B0O80DRAFT_423124 [Mortierella sp. GBAus27b]|nr:hypothetical protein BGX31_011361 [Mortierella sp. GBA43]KAI8360533.1 hypothetical protein B0O80DRAFT_423124 [Mortierella sp. GBAus27b]